MSPIIHKIVIIGGGPAGMAAAVSAFDNGVEDVIILDREPLMGGILKQCIHNGFGLHRLGKELTGPEYAAHFENEVKKRNIKVLYETTVTSVSGDKIITAQNRNGILQIKAEAVILAMGCRERSRGALNIPGTRPAGVYSAGTAQKLMNCDGYKIGNRVVILGSGDIGLIMARRLTLEGAKVEAVCEILPYSGGLTRNIVQCLNDYDIPLYLSHTVAEIHGEKRVKGVTIAKVDENRNIIDSTKRYIPCDTLLLSVGLIPENELTADAGIPIDRVTGGAVTDQYRQTEIEGFFSCGNVLQVHDLVDYVSDEADIAGKSAALWVQGKLIKEINISTRAGEGIRYVIPQKITCFRQDLSLYMRVTKPFGRVRISVKCGDETISSAVRIKAVPGEMEKILLKSDKIPKSAKEIVVSLEEL